MSAPARSIALGLVDDPPLDLQSVALEPGTLVLAYTDGVTEAMDEEGAQFGREQLDGSMATWKDQPAQNLSAKIVERVEAHMGKAQQSDDITVPALRMM